MIKSTSNKNSLFEPISNSSTLSDSSTEVHVDSGTQIIENDSPLESRFTKIDRFVGWDARLDSDALKVRERVLGIVQDWEPFSVEAFQKGIFPDEIFRELGQAGAIGASLINHGSTPPLSRLATCGIMHAVEYGDGGLRCALTVHDCVLLAISRFGTQTQKDQWFTSLKNGELVSAFALTEPHAGSDIRAISTKATRQGDDWIINGDKSWITNGPRADVLLIWARTSERNDTIRGFLVEKGTAGLEVKTISTAASMRIAPVGRIHLENLRVPHSALLPHAWGLSDINDLLDYNRLTVLFGATGGARKCLEIAHRYTAERELFSVPLASKQLIQTMLADMTEKVSLGELTSLHLAERWTKTHLPRFDVSLSKRSNCAGALEVARMARTILGANGCDLAFHVIRHLLNLEASYSYGGTNEIHGLIVGKELTGENAF